MNDPAPLARPDTLGEARDWLAGLTPDDVPVGLRLRPWLTVTDPARWLDWLCAGLASGADGGHRVRALDGARDLWTALYPTAP